MALFSFRHSVKTFSEKRADEARIAKLGQTAAHLRYICRPQAARVVMRERLVGGDNSTASKAAEDEAQRRKGRVCERFVIALPVEVTEEQRENLARAYAEKLSGGIAGYVVGIHDQHGNDRKNPHAHFVFFDVQQKTEGRGRPKSTLGLARKYAIERSAKLWADLHNEMMRSWGYGPDTEISHLSYADRGLDQVATIHEGAGARATPKKKMNAKLEWRRIDDGHTRAEANQIIREINKLKGHENERADQLGGNHEGDRTQRQCGLSKQRERSRRDGQVVGSDRPPFVQVGGNKVGTSKPEHASTAMRASEQRGVPRRPGQHPPFLVDARLGLIRFLRRRGSVRRVFRELVMLRDALTAHKKDQLSHEESGMSQADQRVNLDQYSSR
ncbi:MobA/MobL family protein [Aliiroseovarius lamellibrachiae]|uniref:MobA/MobL family protein n=1 Tax=Aliiroseovarius lamellibrachiae TaxID=1924933 RepID=UPI001BE07519|nr:MobA/MobL family protein [Aliiroseovarius lamellibrachiae]MBT2130636.1 MobA/MobL family protein [Aliiroseovarius lamellibrachiae]